MSLIPEVISLVLALVYLLTFLLCLCRTYKLYCNSWPQTQLFYASVTLQSVLRSLAFALQCLDLNLTVQLDYLLLYGPDSLFLVSYLMLFWLLLFIAHHAHMDLGNAQTAGPRLKRVAKCIWVMIVFWVLVEGVLYTLYFTGVIGSEAKTLEISIVNIALPGFVLTCQLGLQVSYSGIPFRSKLFSDRHQVVVIATLIWSLGRLLRGVLGVIYPYSITQSVQDTSEAWSPALFIIVLICTEIMCYLVVLDYGYMSMFQLTLEDSQVEDHLIPVASAVEADLTGFEADRQLEFNDAEVKCTHELPIRPTALGHVFLANFRERIVVYRRVNLKRVSTYIKEELLEEFLALKSVTSEHVTPFIGCTLDGSVVGLLVAYFHQGSLFNLLHETKEQLASQVKVRIATEIAMGMRDLYYQGQTHGHLTSHNVLLDGDKTVIISDFGLERMRKYAGLMCNYCNKSGWTSPEQMRDDGPVATQVQESDDVYSFGVILWELLTGKVPFPNLPPEDIKHVVSKLNYRPELTSDIDEVLAQLIKSCWNISPANRPSFKLVYSTLCLIQST